jgi:hypothetical protein
MRKEIEKLDIETLANFSGLLIAVKNGAKVALSLYDCKNFLQEYKCQLLELVNLEIENIKDKNGTWRHGFIWNKALDKAQEKIKSLLD